MEGRIHIKPTFIINVEIYRKIKIKIKIKRTRSSAAGMAITQYNLGDTGSGWVKKHNKNNDYKI
jgi:hypothetical protein